MARLLGIGVPTFVPTECKDEQKAENQAGSHRRRKVGGILPADSVSLRQPGVPTTVRIADGTDTKASSALPERAMHIRIQRRQCF